MENLNFIFPTRGATFRILWGEKPCEVPKDHACKVSSKSIQLLGSDAWIGHSHIQTSID